MTDTWYIDYSAAPLDGQTIVNTAVGPQGEHASGAIRYIEDITNPSLVRKKHITKAEYQSLLAAGVAMPAMFMEVSTDDPVGGYAQGQAYARRALAGADYLGWTGKILFCCDGWMNSVGVTASQWRNYLDGAVSVLGDRAGGYGFSDAADLAQGHVASFVQCGARSAVRSWVNGWQDNSVQPYVGGVQADRILILNPFTSTEDALTASASDQINQMYTSVSRVYAATGKDWSDVLISLAQLFPGPVDTQGILARGGHSAGDLVNADHSTWEAVIYTVIPQLQKMQASVDVLAAAVAKVATNPDITPGSIKTMIDEAFAESVQITGTVQVGPAPKPAPAPAPAPQAPGAAQ